MGVSSSRDARNIGFMQADRIPTPAQGDADSAPAPRQRHECGALPFLIRRDGSWMYRGSPIARKAMVCLFGHALQRDADGVFWLETPAERGYIEVEDAPFIAVEMNWTGSGRDQELTFRTNIDEIVELGPERRLRVDWRCDRSRLKAACGSAPVPYIDVRPSRGQPIEARLSRPVYYELAALAQPGCVDGTPCMGVWSRGVFFPVGPAEGGCG
jgi:uncharacterized protein